MTGKPTYPKFTEAMLVPFQAIVVQLKDHPDLLDSPECPYDPKTRAFLKLLEPRDVVREKGTYSEDDLESEINELYDELKRAAMNMDISDAKEKIAMMRTTADLLTKLVQLKEKNLNVKLMAEFQRTVLNCMEAVMTPAQRSEFIELMGKYIVQ